MRTNLVSAGDLGPLVEEELQGRQAASSAGPVDGGGLQLKHTHRPGKGGKVEGEDTKNERKKSWKSLTLSFFSMAAPASSSLLMTSTCPLKEALCSAVLWN